MVLLCYIQVFGSELSEDFTPSLSLSCVLKSSRDKRGSFSFAMADGHYANGDDDVAAATGDKALHRDAQQTYVDGEDSSSLSSGEYQPGVKNIEAVSQTWTMWALYMVYAG